MSTLTLSFLVLAIVSGVACGPPRTEPPPAGIPVVSTVTLEAAALTLTTELPGRVVAFKVAEIRPQVNGIIQERTFIQGDDVEAGTVLYQIDPALYQAARDQAAAALKVAEANLPALRSRAERLRGMAKARAASEQDVDDAEAAVAQAEANEAAAKAALELARVNLSYTPITAPIEGRIGPSQVTVGALVTAYQPNALAVIQQLDPVYVDVSQATAELLRLRRAAGEGALAESEGAHRVTLVLEDGSTYPLEGTLAFRDVTASQTTGSVTVRMVFPNPDGVLLPGMFVRTVVEEGVMPEAVLAPQQGVTRNTKGEPIAWVVTDDDTVEERKLEVDRTIGDTWLVMSGLGPGDRVIVEGRLNVRPGAVVDPFPFGEEASSSPPDHGDGVARSMVR